jgi:hypothetical protein
MRFLIAALGLRRDAKRAPISMRQMQDNKKASRVAPIKLRRVPSR